MDFKLFIEAITKYLSGLLLIGLLLFVSAGTISYWNGWLFICLLFVPMFIAGIVMLIKNPDLLRKRLKAKEKEREQSEVLLLSGIMFLLGFVASGLSYRFEWLVLPKELVIIGSVTFVFAYLLYAEVLRENTYLSRTIEVQKNQKVIDTGVYRIVRHPMYFSTILLFLAMPLVLGSLISFLIFCAYPFIIAKRIANEEKVMEAELVGYSEYKKKVRYRMIPFIW